MSFHALVYDMIQSFRAYFVRSMPYIPIEPHVHYVNTHCMYNTFCLAALIAPDDAYDFYMFANRFDRIYDKLRDTLFNPPDYNHVIFVKAFNGIGHSFSIIYFEGEYSTYESNYLKQLPTLEPSDVDIILNKLHALDLKYLEWFIHPIPSYYRLWDSFNQIERGIWVEKNILRPWQLLPEQTENQ